MESGALDDAVVSFDRGLAFAETFGAAQVRGRLLNNKGVVLSKLGRWSDALEAYEASLAVRTSLDDRLLGLVTPRRGVQLKRRQLGRLV